MYKGIYTNRRGETRYAGPKLFDTAADALAYATKYAATRGTDPRVLDCRPRGEAGRAEWNRAMGHEAS